MTACHNTNVMERKIAFFIHKYLVRRVVVVAQSLRSCTTLCDPMNCSTPGFPSLKDRLPCPSLFPRVCSDSCPLSRWCYLTISSSAAPFSLCLQSFPALVFSNELALCIRWPKYWSFNFSISPWNEYSGLISFRTDWFDLLAVQETLNSLLQHHSSKT